MLTAIEQRKRNNRQPTPSADWVLRKIAFALCFLRSGAAQSQFKAWRCRECFALTLRGPVAGLETLTIYCALKSPSKNSNFANIAIGKKEEKSSVNQRVFQGELRNFDEWFGLKAASEKSEEKKSNKVKFTRKLIIGSKPRAIHHTLIELISD